MDLDRISVVLRPRAPREALDLGAVMLRANARAVWSAWFAFTLPIFVACNALGVLLGLPWLGLVLVWWLKPLFDRLPLYVLSRAVFDRAPSWRETLRGQAQWKWRSTLASLSWLRIDSSRALRLPMELLEGAPRKQRAARWKVLRRRIVADTSLLTYGCLQFELVLFLSVCLLALMLVPHEWRPESFSSFFRHDVRGAATVWWMVGTSLAYLAMSAIEPLYVACGFALYLNRRTQLEAWDIDLAFQRLRTRLQSLGKALVLLLVLGSSMPSWVYAAASSERAPPVTVTSPEKVFQQPLDSSDQRFAQAATEAYRDPHFGGEKTTRRWLLKYKFASDSRVTTMPFPGFGQALASAFNLFLWLMLIVAVAALLHFAWRWRGRLMSKSPAPSALMLQDTRLLDMAETPLPEDLAAAARALWQARHRRQALALLYRGCVEQTARLLQIPVSPDATEADWLRKAASIEDPSRAQRVAAIVRTWQLAAYAGRYPDDVELEQLLVGWPAQTGRSA
jgi:hypothetical protein